MRNPEYILILDDEFQIDVTEIKDNESLDEYYYICDIKFLSENDAYDYIIKAINIIGIIPNRRSFESRELYSRRIRTNLKDLWEK